MLCRRAFDQAANSGGSPKRRLAAGVGDGMSNSTKVALRCTAIIRQVHFHAARHSYNDRGDNTSTYASESHAAPMFVSFSAFSYHLAFKLKPPFRVGKICNKFTI